MVFISVFLPLLVFSSDCQLEWNKILASQLNEQDLSDYNLMLMSSGFVLNNLGDYYECNRIDSAKYVVIEIAEHPAMIYTLCGPEVCTKEDYYSLNITGFNFGFNNEVNIIFPREYQNNNYDTLSTGAILMIVFIGILTSICIAGTIFDLFWNDDDKSSKFGIFLLCFSFVANLKIMLLRKNQIKKCEGDNLEILNGIRALSIGWIVAGHSFNLSSVYLALSNPASIPYFYADIKNLLALSATYGVDTFFWLSAFLLGYFLAIELDKNPNFSLKHFVTLYVHRYLRITPLNMFVILFFWSLQVYLGGGPRWYNVDRVIIDCPDYWYTNLFYLRNFLEDIDHENCLTASWYLSVDFQFFVISPFAIYCYCKINKVLGLLFIGILYITGIVTSGVITDYYNLDYLTFQNAYDYYTYYYYMPYTRIPPFAIGLFCALIAFTYKKFKETSIIYDRFLYYIVKSQENLYIRLFTFLSGLILINTIIFARYPVYDNYTDPYWNQTQNTIFMAFDRAAFGLGISLVFLPMLLGYFPIISAILSWYPWSILSRLTFAMYLINYSIVQTFYLSQRNVIVLDDYNAFMNAAYIFILTTIFSIPIVLMIEMPSMNLEKILLHGQPSKPTKDIEKPKEEDALLNKNEEQDLSLSK